MLHVSPLGCSLVANLPQHNNILGVCCDKSSSQIAEKGQRHEYEYCTKVGTDPYMAFEKDFLRPMLSDGASAVFLSDKKNENGLSLKAE